MLQRDERFHEGWRKAEGYWGDVLTKSGVGNSKSNRKRIYMDWKRNVNNFREKYNQLKKKMDDHTVINDEVSNLYNIYVVFMLML